MLTHSSSLTILRTVNATDLFVHEKYFQSICCWINQTRLRRLDCSCPFRIDDDKCFGIRMSAFSSFMMGQLSLSMYLLHVETNE